MIDFGVMVTATVSLGVCRVVEIGGRTSSDAVTEMFDAEYDFKRNTSTMVIMSIIGMMLRSLISPAFSRSLRFFRAIAERNIIRWRSSSETSTADPGFAI